jgi:uridine kinase
MSYDALVAEVLSQPGPVRLVAIDGPGGAGKSTFARRLSRRAGDAPIVHTDDFASWEEPLQWWPRLLEQVIEPLASGEQGCFQRYDWEQRRLADWVVVERSPVVVLEGVSAARREWSEHLAYGVFVSTSARSRLLRGLARDGASMREQWHSWMEAEDRHFAEDRAMDRAELIVDGEPMVDHRPEEQFVVLRRRPRRPAP